MEQGFEPDLTTKPDSSENGLLGANWWPCLCHARPVWDWQIYHGPWVYPITCNVDDDSYVPGLVQK